MKAHHYLMLIAIGAGLAAVQPALAQRLDPANTPAKGRATTPPKMVPNASGDGGLGLSILAADVGADAVIITGSGTTGAVHLGSGIYEVDFERDVTKCFYTASSFNSGATPTALEPRVGAANGVFLTMQKLDGTQSLIDQRFHLIVFCPN